MRRPPVASIVSTVDDPGLYHRTLLRSVHSQGLPVELIPLAQGTPTAVGIGAAAAEVVVLAAQWAAPPGAWLAALLAAAVGDWGVVVAHREHLIAVRRGLDPDPAVGPRLAGADLCFQAAAAGYAVLAARVQLPGCARAPGFWPQLRRLHSKWHRSFPEFDGGDYGWSGVAMRAWGDTITTISTVPDK